MLPLLHSYMLWLNTYILHIHTHPHSLFFPHIQGAPKQPNIDTPTPLDLPTEDDQVIRLRMQSAENRRNTYVPWLHEWMVPYIVSLSDVVFGLASGMTIKFFPIYFAHVLTLPRPSSTLSLCWTLSQRFLSVFLPRSCLRHTEEWKSFYSVKLLE